MDRLQKKVGGTNLTCNKTGASQARCTKRRQNQRLGVWVHLPDILEGAKLKAQRTDEWLPGLREWWWGVGGLLSCCIWVAATNTQTERLIRGGSLLLTVPDVHRQRVSVVRSDVGPLPRGRSPVSHCVLTRLEGISQPSRVSFRNAGPPVVSAHPA